MSLPITVRPATSADSPLVWQLYQRCCAAQTPENPGPMWTIGVYPAPADLAKAIEQQRLFVAYPPTPAPQPPFDLETATAVTRQTPPAAIGLDSSEPSPLPPCLPVSLESTAPVTWQTSPAAINLDSPRPLPQQPLSPQSLSPAPPPNSPCRPAGAFTLSFGDDPEYQKVNWQFAAQEQEISVLHLLAVDPDLRGQGVASQLLTAAFALAQSQGAKVMHLDITKVNAPARSLYERFGFHFAGEHTLFYEDTGEMEFLMFEKLL